MNSIKVSILVPAFNVEEYIDDCLQSLMHQTLKEIEVIVVDDGSTDKTGKIAEKYAALDKRFHVVHQSHQGVATARNVCLSLAKGKYIGFVDSDDYISENGIEELFLCAETHLADIVLGSILHCFEDGTCQRIGDKSFNQRLYSEPISGKHLFKVLIEVGEYTPMVCGNLYKLAFIRQSQLCFEAIFHEDEFFTPYVLYFANRVICANHDFYYYRQRANSIMNIGTNLRERSGSLYFISAKLTEFAKSNIASEEIKQAFLLHASSLCSRAQHLYEKELYRSSKRCLFIITEHSIANQYGIGTYIRQLTQCFNLVEWDLNVIVLHSVNKRIQWKMEEGVAYYEIPMPDELLYSGLPLYEQLYCKGVFYYLVSRLQLPKEVYCHFNFTSHYYLALLFKEKMHAKIIFTLHFTDWSFDLLGDQDWLKRILANPAGRKEKRLVDAFEREKKFMHECCDSVIAIARHSYDMLKELYDIPESKLAYVPNGLRDEYRKRNADECRRVREKYGFKEKENLLIFAGRLDFVKGVMGLIEAFKQVLIEMPDTKLIIAGTGNFTHCLDVAKPCWSHIIFTGFIPREELFELYAIADMGIVPSIHEEFGYVAAEMMMNELPVIVNNTTGLKEIVGDGEYGTVFDFGKDKNIRALKDRIVDVLTCNEKEVYAREGRSRVLKEYSIQDFSEKIVGLYSLYGKSMQN